MGICSSSRSSSRSSRIDRISDLPEGILHHIFSFLNIEEAIRSSFWSRRWRFFWTTIPTLNFEYNVMIPRGRRLKNSITMKELVDQVLLRRDNSSSLKRFTLCFVRCNSLDPWINYARTHNVQEFDVRFGMDKLDRFPFRFFTCSSLKVLKLSSCRYPTPELLLTPDLASLPALETLELDGFSFSEDDINDKLFSVCPNLEYLEITAYSFRSTHVSISSDKLKHLGLTGVGPDNKISYVNIKLNTPNLISFKCGGFLLHDYCFENIASLVKADIDLALFGDRKDYSKLNDERKKVYGQRAMAFLKAVLNVVEDTNKEVKSLEEVQNVKDEILAAKSLKLSVETLEILSGSYLLEGKSPSRFSSLRTLELKAYASRDSVIGMMYLLKISPNVESLVIELTQNNICPTKVKAPFPEPHYPNHSKIPNQFIFTIFTNLLAISGNQVNVDSRDYREPGLPFDCWLYHLKTVEFRVVVRGFDFELKLLEIVLKNALVLEKLTIVFDLLNGEPPDIKSMAFYEKLVTLPKASSHVTISRCYHRPTYPLVTIHWVTPLLC